MREYQRLPKHIGIIPDGNRRWALSNGMNKEDGYNQGIRPGLELYEECLRLGIRELTFYGFTVENTKRPPEQIRSFQKACVDSVSTLLQKDANLLVVGDSDSPFFPPELLPYTKRTELGRGIIKVNFLVNYGWDWDLRHMARNGSAGSRSELCASIASSDISKIDLIIRWGGRRRLSGFLPLQSVYADIYVVEDMWPDFSIDHLHQALAWYQHQDVTLGG